MQSTLDLSAKFGVESYSLVNLIRKHQHLFEPIECYNIKTTSGQGRPTVYYELTDKQVDILITLMKNTDSLIPFKVDLVERACKK